mgnify:CR=1 FL=1
MTKYIVQGGHPLFGEVEISGAKNAVVAILPAVILSDGVCHIDNIPNIADVSTALEILSGLGAVVRRVDKHAVEIDPRSIFTHTVPHDLARHMRASYYFIGSLLGRYGEARVSMPGGCNFGVRPIDQHLKGFSALGAVVSPMENGMIEVQTDRLVGNSVYLDMVSVGATINIMLAAVRAKGTTIIENAAKEPHIVDLANFLNSMGANIRGAGTDTIKIQGVDRLRGGSYAIIPDQIEAGTYMAAVAATGGQILVKNIIPKHMDSIIPDQIEAGTYMAAVAAAGGEVLIKNVIPKHLDCITAKLVEMGVEVEEREDTLLVRRSGPLQKANVKTMPYPGFPTDMQPQITTVLCLAEGTSLVTESVWNNRYRYVDELKRMGASIQVDDKTAVVEGVDHLTGAPIQACDLRAGAALVIAALAAKGESEISCVQYIERGYEDIIGKLRALGADIRAVEEPDEDVLSTAQIS